MTYFKSGGQWPLLVAALILMNIGVCIVTVVSATGDKGFSVVRDYDVEALHWDEHARRLAASRALGWKAEVAPLSTAPATPLLVSVVDREGHPVADAKVQAEFFHQAASSQRVVVHLSPLGHGRYQAAVPAPRPGLYRLNLTASRGSEWFFHTQDLSASPIR